MSLFCGAIGYSLNFPISLFFFFGSIEENIFDLTSVGLGKSHGKRRVIIGVNCSVWVDVAACCIFVVEPTICRHAKVYEDWRCSFTLLNIDLTCWGVNTLTAYLSVWKAVTATTRFDGFQAPARHGTYMKLLLWIWGGEGKMSHFFLVASNAW